MKTGGEATLRSLFIREIREIHGETLQLIREPSEAAKSYGQIDGSEQAQPGSQMFLGQ